MEDTSKLFRALDELKIELQDKYPKLTIRRDGAGLEEVLLIYEGDNVIATLGYSKRYPSGEVKIDCNDEPFPTFAKAKAQLMEWLKNHMRYSDYL